MAFSHSSGVGSGASQGRSINVVPATPPDHLSPSQFTQQTEPTLSQSQQAISYSLNPARTQRKFDNQRKRGCSARCEAALQEMRDAISRLERVLLQQSQATQAQLTTELKQALDNVRTDTLKAIETTQRHPGAIRSYTDVARAGRDSGPHLPVP